MIFTSLDQIKTKYTLLYSDPPWLYYGDPNKDQAAGKHYDCMASGDLKSMSVREIVAKRAVHIMWVTSTKVGQAVELLEAWGTPFRAIFQVWVKTRRDGTPIVGQGVRPSFTKATGELMLIGSTHPKGRTLPILTEAMEFFLFAPRPPEHSQKPEKARQNIEALFGTKIPRIELFARRTAPGWDSFGNEVEPHGYRLRRS